MFLRVPLIILLVMCNLTLGCKNNTIQFIDCESFTHNFWNRTYSFESMSVKISCREKDPMDPCNPIADYYDGKTHYIRRDLVTDDGNLDYKKLLEDAKPENSECYPANHEVK
ncbi:hypothetical protein [Leptospira ognonensis]|nr:hypothetical protein [Leptospira ognonensis]